MKVLSRILAVTAAACIGSASAASFGLNTIYTGATPSSPAPWLNALVTDTATGVDIVFTAPGLTGTEFVSDWGFQLTAGAAPVLSSPGTLPATQLQVALNAINGPGSSSINPYNDLVFNFENSNSSVNRFQGGETFAVSLTGISEAHFLGSGAHIQGLVNGQSGKAHSVPEPSSALASLFVLGVGGLLLRRRKSV